MGKNLLIERKNECTIVPLSVLCEEDYCDYRIRNYSSHFGIADYRCRCRSEK